MCLLLTELVAGLRDQRLPDGTTDSVGEVLMNWVRLSHFHSQLCFSIDIC